MPVIRLHASTAIPREAQLALKRSFGDAIATVPGKSEQWLMCTFDEQAPMFFAGDDTQPCALVEVSVFARTQIAAEVWEELTGLLTPAVSEALGIDPTRIYVEYRTTAHFGWNGSNF